MITQRILLAVHIISSTLWVGSVFMNAFIVWPTLRNLQRDESFPLDFLAMEGKRIAPWLYMSATMTLLSGAILIALEPPENYMELWLLSAKGVVFASMIANTIYGTLVTWPALQFSTGAESWQLWRGYIIRAYITFGCGIAAIGIGTTLR